MSSDLTPKKQLENLLLLSKKGYNVPTELLRLVRDSDRRSRGIKEVWTCKTCREKYESLQKLKGVTCKSGHEMRLAWKDS